MGVADEHAELIGFFVAAVQAVVYRGTVPAGRLPQTGEQVWEWVTGCNPTLARMVGGLTAGQRMLVQEILDGMLREKEDRSRLSSK